jgi:stage III sporulation protein SpoIIIAA
MEENYVPLSKFDIEPSLDDKFWEEKVKRSIQECNSVSALKEMATLLLRIATQRNGVIRGLVKDIHIFNNVLVDTNDIANPELKS